MIYRTAVPLPLSSPLQGGIPNAGLNRVSIEGGLINIPARTGTQHLSDVASQPV